MDEFRCIQLRDKRIYLVENHHQTLFAMSEEFRINPVALNMLTLDQHCDVLPAFGRYYESDEAGRADEISKFNPFVYDSVVEAVTKLRHDEHIDLALRSGLLNGSAVIAKENFTVPAHEKIFIACDLCWPETTQLLNHPEDYQNFNIDLLKDEFLARQLANIHNGSGIDFLDEATKYVLDIDLDYFMAEEALNFVPEDMKIIKKLYSHAEFVTVSLEECWVKIMRPKYKSYTSDELFERLLELFGRF